MATEYNPIDLAFLVNGWIQGSAEQMKGDYEGLIKALSVERVTMLEDAARILARLYEEVQDEWTGAWEHGEWTGVWEHEVVEPLGIWIGRAFAWDGDMPHLDEIEAEARDIIAKAMKAAKRTRP